MTNVINDFLWNFRYAARTGSGFVDPVRAHPLESPSPEGDSIWMGIELLRDFLILKVVGCVEDDI